MNDPTNWNADDEVGSFAFASPEEAKKAEAVMNRALKESFENGRNVALEEAAQIFEKDESQRWGYTADLPVISAAIRALKRYDAAKSPQSKESK